MTGAEIGTLVGTAVGVVVAIVVATVKVLRSRREDAPPPPPTPATRLADVTGSHRLGGQSEDAATLALLLELAVEIRGSLAQAASDRTRDRIDRESIARMAESVDQIYVSQQRTHGAVRQLEADLRRVARLFEQLASEIASRHSRPPPSHQGGRRGRD